MLNSILISLYIYIYDTNYTIWPHIIGIIYFQYYSKHQMESIEDCRRTRRRPHVIPAFFYGNNNSDSTSRKNVTKPHAFCICNVLLLLLNGRNKQLKSIFIKFYSNINNISTLYYIR